MLALLKIIGVIAMVWAGSQLVNVNGAVMAFETVLNSNVAIAFFIGLAMALLPLPKTD